MRRLPFLIAAAAALASPALAQRQPAATAQAQAAEREAPLDALLKASARGETAPLVRALQAERDPDVRTLLQARLAAMRLGEDALADPRLRRLAAAGTDPVLRRAALAIIASVAFTRGDYAEAVQAGRPLLALQRAAGDARQAEETALTLRLAEMLADEPRLAVERQDEAGSTPARRDAAGLVRADVGINGHSQDAVIDTGANLSVLSESAARRLGVRMLEGESRVGNSVQGTVGVRLGIADRVEIAGTMLRNVVFLIIEDSQLTFPVAGGYTIPAIIGFPEMKALGRFRVDFDRLSVEPPAAGRAASGRARNLSSWGNELFVDVEVGGVAVPLHLDSGATRSHLDPPFAAANPRLIAGLPREERRMSGAGGTATAQAVNWRNVPVEIAGRTFRAPSVPVGVGPANERSSRYFGVAGIDLLRAFESFTVDLRAMRLELGEPRAR